MHIPSEKEFPQFRTAHGGSIKNDANDKYTAVYNRPVGLLHTEATDSGLILTAATAAKRPELSYTHETALYLLKPCDTTVERLYIHVELWSETVFKVMLSKEKHPKSPFARLPKDARMLIAEPQKVAFETFETPQELVLKTAKIEIHIDKEELRISALDGDGKEYFAQRKNHFRTADVLDFSIGTSERDVLSCEALELLPDEWIYGLGERFDSFVRNGRAVDFHNKDAVGTTSRRTYLNIPFYISTKGYGLFLNSGAETTWNIATDDAASLQFSVSDDQMEYFVIGGHTPKEILKSYCMLTGFAPLPPLWSFGLWMSRNSYTSWDVVDDIADQIRKHDIPCDVLHLDTAWFQTDWDCDLKFSEERFPDPVAYGRPQKAGISCIAVAIQFYPAERGQHALSRSGRQRVSGQKCKRRTVSASRGMQRQLDEGRNHRFFQSAGPKVVRRQNFRPDPNGRGRDQNRLRRGHS